MLRFATWKIVTILVVTFAAMALVIPSLMPKEAREAAVRVLPSFIPFRPIVLGLDLQGGAHVLMEVDTADVVKKLVDGAVDDSRRVLRENKVPITGGIGRLARGAQVRFANDADRAKALPVLQNLAQPIGNVLLGGATGRTLDVKQTDDGAVQLTVTDKIGRAVDQSIEVLRRRIDPGGNKEISIQRQGRDRVLIELPGVQDTRELVGMLKTAKLEFRAVAEPGTPPSEFETLPSKDGGKLDIVKSVVVAGEDLTDAQPGFDSRGGEPVVNFRFNIRGGQRFCQYSSENVNKPFAIVLDNDVISAPKIISPICGGSGQISGRFTVKETTELSTLLRAGALPAKLTIIEERTVGPGLGQDSIDAGKRAAYLGTALVVGFMLVTYGIFGVFANLALAIHVILIFAGMAITGATLTMPGIAGIVLTIGMAVDSNVLIYERIREEFKMGRSIVSALDAGFTRAFATIVDSNVTMLIAAIVLFILGSGPVKGFAVTLALGIVTTIFTAVTMTRLMIALWYRTQRPRALPI